MSDARPVHVGAVVVRNGEALFVRQTPTHSLGAVWTSEVANPFGAEGFVA